MWIHQPSSGSLEWRRTDWQGFHSPSAWRGRGRWWWPKCFQRGPSLKKKKCWSTKEKREREASLFMKLTIRRTAICRSVTWAVCVQQNHFRDFKSLDHCMSMCKDPTICILSLSYFSFSNLVQSGGNNPDSENDHLRFSNWKTMKQRFSNWKTMKQRFSNWEPLKKGWLKAIQKTLYVGASAALDRLVQPSWHSFCSRLYFCPCGSNVFLTLLLNQTVFNSRKTLIKICAFFGHRLSKRDLSCHGNWQLRNEAKSYKR